MKPEHIQLFKKLLTEQRVLALSVLLDGLPYTGLLPFVVSSDFSACVVHASDLARHSKGMDTASPHSILVHEGDLPEIDPLQIVRIMLQGRVSRLEKGSALYAANRDRYLQKFPTSTQTFMLGDFHLYALNFERGRLVAGFGQAINITPDSIQTIRQSAAHK